MVAPPYLTWAAEGFELLPACLILQLLQELQPGSSGSISCILQTCWGTVSLHWIHRQGEWEGNTQQNGRYTGLPLSYGSGKAKNNPQCSLLDGWCPPAFATKCFVPLPAPEVGEHHLPQPQQCPAQWARGSRKMLFLGESHSASVTPCPSQALPTTASPAVH